MGSRMSVVVGFIFLGSFVFTSIVVFKEEALLSIILEVFCLFVGGVFAFFRGVDEQILGTLKYLVLILLSLVHPDEDSFFFGRCFNNFFDSRSITVFINFIIF